MSEDRIFEGNTVEDALAAASRETGLAAGQFQHEVIQAPRRGLLGLFARPARIRVSVEPGARPASEGRTFLAELLAGMGLTAEVGLQTEGDTTTLEITGSDAGWVAERGSELVGALELLVTRAAGGPERHRFRIDAAGYRRDRQAELARLARELADQARESGRAALSPRLDRPEQAVLRRELRRETGVSVREGRGRGAGRLVIESAGTSGTVNLPGDEAADEPGTLPRRSRSRFRRRRPRPGGPGRTGRPERG